MKLTNTQVKQAKATGKTYKLSDGAGMYLEVSPTGRKWWRYKYRINGKEKRFAIGVYPDVSLKEARDRLFQARKLVETGVDPSENRKAIQASREQNEQNTLEVLAREWHAKNIEKWTEKHGADIIRRFEQNIFPYLGNKPINNIKPFELLKVLEKVQDRGAVETAHRLLQYCSKVCRYAALTERTDRDFTIGLKETLKPVQKKHLAAITDPERFGELLRAMDDFPGNEITKLALKFAPLVFVRPGEMRQAEWKEIELKEALWKISAHKMKGKADHIVPLSKQALEILNELHELTGHTDFVFPSHLTRTRPMSNNTVNMALRRIGFTKEEVTAHGFRATARTLLDEVLKFPPYVIEQQLAHVVKDPLGQAYNRTAHLEQRVEMMQEWANYLDNLKANSTRKV